MYSLLYEIVNVFTYYHFVACFSSALVIIGITIPLVVKFFFKRTVEIGIIHSLVFILSATLLFRHSRTDEGYLYILDFGWSYIRLIEEFSIDVFEELIGNIILFIPLGFFMTKFLENKEKYILIIITIGFVFSLCVELIQFLFKLGIFEIDDIINNTIGLIIGFFVYKLMNRIKKSSEDV